MNNVIAAPANISIDSPFVTFVQTFFRWAGGVPKDAMFKALEDAGVPKEMWPNEPSDNTCLKRAFDEVATGRRSLIRPLKKGLGWSLVIEDEEQLDLENAVHGSAHNVELTGKVYMENHVMSLVLTPETHPMVPLVRAEFEKQRELFQCSADLSVWMTQHVIPWCHGVAARDRGGFYYVPKPEGVERLRSVAAAVHGVSTRGGSRNRLESGGKIYLIPSVQQDDLMEAILDAIIEEADKVCIDMQEKLVTGDLGRRALATQNDRAKQLENKLKKYENFLGQSLEDVTNRVGEVQAGIGMAELALDHEVK